MTVPKLYVSLPISGQEDTIEQRYNDILDYCEQHYPEYDLIFPIDINEFFDDVDRTTHETYLWYMGKDILLMSECEAILMTKDWENSFGCNIEHELAKHTNMKIYYV